MGGNFVTYFDALERGPMQTWVPVIFGVLFLFASIALWFRREPMMPNRSPGARVFLCILFITLSAVWTAIAAVRIASGTRAINAAVRDHTVQTAVGTVSRYKAAFARGDFYERFCVQQACFSYLDFLPSAGFHETALYGGPIQPDLPVRVFYVGNIIIRLEFVPMPKRQRAEPPPVAEME